MSPRFDVTVSRSESMVYSFATLAEALRFAENADGTIRNEYGTVLRRGSWETRRYEVEMNDGWKTRLNAADEAEAARKAEASNINRGRKAVSVKECEEVVFLCEQQGEMR